MLGFLYTCPRHQRMFAEAAERGGCHDLEGMDDIRRKTLAWLATKFPRAVLDHFNEASCLGCQLEANGVDLKEIEGAVVELAKGVAPEEVRR